MAKYTATFAADASNTYVCTVHKTRQSNDFYATVVLSGGFGSGTLTMLLSPDGGTTKVALSDASGTVISKTSAGTINIRLGVGGTNSDSPIIYATLAGSTNPTLTLTVFDNN